jgi:hypothetical protein
MPQAGADQLNRTRKIGRELPIDLIVCELSAATMAAIRAAYCASTVAKGAMRLLLQQVVPCFLERYPHVSLA